MILKSNLKRIDFLTATQKAYYTTIRTNSISFATGYPGTGKTFVACYAGLKALTEGRVSRIVITKPCVEVGSDSLGALPGDMEEKMAPFIRSIEECLSAIVGHEATKRYRASGQIEILPLNHMRGLTLDNAFVIADEMQNSTYLQLKTFLTRIGNNTTYVINGDLGQKDIDHPSGLVVFLQILDGLPGVGVVDFKLNDIVRSGMLKELMIRIYEYEEIELARSPRARSKSS